MAVKLSSFSFGQKVTATSSWPTDVAGGERSGRYAFPVGVGLRARVGVTTSCKQL